MQFLRGKRFKTDNHALKTSFKQSFAGNHILNVEIKQCDIPIPGWAWAAVTIDNAKNMNMFSRKFNNLITFIASKTL